MNERMRGVNLGGWFSQVDAIEEKDPDTFPGLMSHIESFLSPQDFSRIAKWGFNHVRLPLDYFNAFQGPTLVPEEKVLRLLDKAVDNIISCGLSVILDLHKCPGHDFHEGGTRAQSFFSDPGMRADARKVWTHLAERYGDKPQVMLEILNEPVAEDASVWDKIKDEMAAHIRRYAPKSTLVVGSNRWNSASEFAHLTPIEDDNVLYSFHFYNPLPFTHQKAPWLTLDYIHESRAYPGTYALPVEPGNRHPLDSGTWNRERMEKQMEAALNFRERHKVPVACNEFGVYVGGADRDSHLNWMRDVLSILQDHDVGWSYWNYKNLDFGLVSRGESLFSHYPQYDNPERTDYELVELLRKL